jgi:hypothetical protein
VGRQSGAHRKSRTAVTDNNGQYKIVDLRPGTCTVTFTLTFSVITRAGIQLPSAFTATVNADLKIGSLKRTSPSPARRRWSTSRTRFSRSSSAARC